MITNAIFLNYHGLGDTIMMVPAIRKFTQVYPEKKVHLLSLERFGDRVSQLLSGLPYIYQHVPIIPDVWNDFSNFDVGMNQMIKVGQEYAEKIGTAEVYPLFCHRHPDVSNFRSNKLFRFARDLRVTYDTFDELKLELVAHENFRQTARLIFRKYQRPAKIFHRLAGNKIKDLEYEDFYHLFKEGTTFEFGNPEQMKSIVYNHLLFGLPSMELTKAMVAEADEVVAADSVLMHMAFAFDKPTTAIFTKTPVLQAAPISEVLGSVNFGMTDPTLGVGLQELLGEVRTYFESNIGDNGKGNFAEMLPRSFPGVESNSSVAGL